MACHPCSCPVCAEHQVEGSAALAVAIKYIYKYVYVDVHVSVRGWATLPHSGSYALLCMQKSSGNGSGGTVGIGHKSSACCCSHECALLCFEGLLMFLLGAKVPLSLPLQIRIVTCFMRLCTIVVLQ